MPKVSIIIPVYNVEKYIRQALDSVVNQTLKDIEIICVNDCSPDNSLAILEKYKEKDNRIKIINLKKNCGLGNARNVAIKEATSDYVMFLDSDDWLELNACELAYEQITKNNNDFVLFGLKDFYEKNGKLKTNLSKVKPFYEKFGDKSFCVEDIDFPFLDNAFSCFKIYKTNFLRDNNIEFCTTLYEDQLFNVKLYVHVKSISILNLPLYYYRRRLGSITQNSNSWSALLSQKRKILDFVKSLNIDESSLLYKSALIAAINSTMSYYYRFSKMDSNIREQLYSDIQAFYVYLNTNFNIEEIQNYIKYPEFNRIINLSYKEKKKQDFFNKIFSIKKVDKPQRRYIIRILGIKLKIKTKINKRKK